MEIVCTVIRRGRHLNSSIIHRYSWYHQQRFLRMSANRLEKEVDELKTNPYYEKYAQKIAALQQTSPEEFLSRVEQRSQEKNKKGEALKER